MPSPFPGMDPYLEHPAWWPGVHHRLIVGLADVLGPVLRPNYAVSVEERVYVGIPEDLFILARPRTIVPDVSISGGPRREPRGGRGTVVLAGPV
jgi:hypothetical protein